MSLDNYATKTERKIIHKLVDDALAAGCVVSVYDGGETTVVKSGDRATILGAMATTGSDRLVMYKNGRRLGWVLLIYGNDADIISDYAASDMVESLVAGAEALAETLQ